ncbi:hypothetical protein CRENBAI_001429 [Crenichthys baileyi]|uniref:Uncharacterized protein n=1 Tax=Crenichthys baileyi TaxID=28760 RepID=A0AAV9S918_9TELE
MYLKKIEQRRSAGRMVGPRPLATRAADCPKSPTEGHKTLRWELGGKNPKGNKMMERTMKWPGHEVQTIVSYSYSYSSSSAYPEPGRGGSRLSRDTQTSLSPDTSSSSSEGCPRRSQASRET